jgi:dTDP-4-amino-4,6-dideoxygalactose transaminase
MLYAKHIYHVYAIRTPKRETIQKSLHSQEIYTGIHYPYPVHLLPAYTDLGYSNGTFPHSELAATQVLSLPMYPELLPQQIQVVCDSLSQANKNASLYE